MTVTTEIERLLGIMQRLRDPGNGCPWDVEQTFETIAPYTIEEAYEVADAIERKHWEALRLELGDLLLQVVYHSRMAEEAKLFDFSDVAKCISDKMVARHPHVFGDAVVEGADAQIRAWEEQKAKERAAKEGGEPSALDGVARGLPSLMRAEKLQKRAARIGFDWPDAPSAFAKIREELDELEAVQDETGRIDAQMDELGDVLFSVVNYARHLGIDSEEALRRANSKFERRFRAMEDEAKRQNLAMDDALIETLERLWQSVKSAERSG